MQSKYIGHLCVSPKSVVLHYTYQFLKQREENIDTALLEGLKTKHTFNVIHVEFFWALFLAIELETVLQIFIPKFEGNKHFNCCYSLIWSLCFTLDFSASILFIWVRNAFMKNQNFKNLSNTLPYKGIYLIVLE